MRNRLCLLFVPRSCGAFQEIDGDALLLLKSEMMMKYLGLKLGPALKLSYHIDKLKQSWPWSSATAALQAPTIGGHQRLYRHALTAPHWEGSILGRLYHRHQLVHISGASRAQMDATSRLFVLYHGARDPPVLTELPKTTPVHRSRALALYRWSSFISIVVIWIEKKLRLVNSSEPNGSSCTSSVKPQYAIYCSFF